MLERSPCVVRSFGVADHSQRGDERAASQSRLLWARTVHASRAISPSAVPGREAGRDTPPGHEQLGSVGLAGLEYRGRVPGESSVRHQCTSHRGDSRASGRATPAHASYRAGSPPTPPAHPLDLPPRAPDPARTGLGVLSAGFIAPPPRLKLRVPEPPARPHCPKRQPSCFRLDCTIRGLSAPGRTTRSDVRAHLPHVVIPPARLGPDRVRRFCKPSRTEVPAGLRVLHAGRKYGHTYRGRLRNASSRVLEPGARTRPPAGANVQAQLIARQAPAALSLTPDPGGGEGERARQRPRASRGHWMHQGEGGCRRGDVLSCVRGPNVLLAAPRPSRPEHRKRVECSQGRAGGGPDLHYAGGRRRGRMRQPTACADGRRMGERVLLQVL